MKKIILLFSLFIVSGNLIARSEWRREQMAGRTGRGSRSQERRAAAQPLRDGRPVIGVHRSRRPGLPGGAERQRWTETNYIPGIGREAR